MYCHAAIFPSAEFTHSRCASRPEAKIRDGWICRAEAAATGVIVSAYPIHPLISSATDAFPAARLSLPCIISNQQMLFGLVCCCVGISQQTETMSLCGFKCGGGAAHTHFAVFVLVARGRIYTLIGFIRTRSSSDRAHHCFMRSLW